MNRGRGKIERNMEGEEKRINYGGEVAGVSSDGDVW